MKRTDLDLASRALGGSVRYVSDEFFAACEALLTPEPPVHDTWTRASAFMGQSIAPARAGSACARRSAESTRIETERLRFMSLQYEPFRGPVDDVLTVRPVVPDTQCLFRSIGRSARHLRGAGPRRDAGPRPTCNAIYFSSLESLRSLSGEPPVWHPGQ